MASQREKYTFVDGRTWLAARELNPRFWDIDLRLVRLEQFQAGYEEAARAITELGLSRVDAVLRPLVNQLQADLNRARQELAQLTSTARADFAAELATAQTRLNALLSQAEAQVQAIRDAVADVVTQTGLWTVLRFIAAPTAATYSYDGQGRINGATETVNGTTRATTYGYDEAGRVATATITHGGRRRVETYNYNPNGSIAGVSISEVAA